MAACAQVMPLTWEDRLREAVPGLLLTFAFGAASFVTWWLLRGTWLKFSALFWAFIYSIIATNLLPRLSSGRFAVGLDLSASRLLRLSIALLGLTISASVWVALGGVGVLAVGARPERSLIDDVKAIVPEVYVIGDCAEPRDAMQAVREGAEMGRKI